MKSLTYELWLGDRGIRKGEEMYLTIHKNQFQIDQRPNCKRQKYMASWTGGKALTKQNATWDWPIFYTKHKKHLIRVKKKKR